MRYSEWVRSLAHKILLVARPLSVGIVNPHRFDLWFLSKPSNSKKIEFAVDLSVRKSVGLNTLKQELIAELNDNSVKTDKAIWKDHPLVEVQYRVIKILAYSIVIIQRYSSKYFESEFYVAKYPEVSNHNESPLSHYAKYGFFLLNSPREGVFNSSSKSDWTKRDETLEDKRSYLWSEAQLRPLLFETEFESLLVEADLMIQTKHDISSGELIETLDGSSLQEGTPLISVIIPCYKQASFLSECLESVALATSEFHECVIVDDGNEDDEELLLLKQVHSMAPHQVVRIVRQENMGLSSARNAGLRVAVGDFIKFLDCDDLLTPGSLDIQILEMSQTNSDADIGGYSIVGTHSENITEHLGPLTDIPLTKDSQLNISKFLSLWEQGLSIPIHCLLIRKTRAITFSPALRSKEDLRMWLELGITGINFSKSPGIVACYRQHSKQMTNNNRAKHGLYFIEVLFDFCQKHPGQLSDESLSNKIRYINGFYSSLPSAAWAEVSSNRRKWLERFL